jgi:hypothetical protein
MLILSQAISHDTPRTMVHSISKLVRISFDDLIEIQRTLTPEEHMLFYPEYQRGRKAATIEIITGDTHHVFAKIKENQEKFKASFLVLNESERMKWVRSRFGTYRQTSGDIVANYDPQEWPTTDRHPELTDDEISRGRTKFNATSKPWRKPTNTKTIIQQMRQALHSLGLPEKVEKIFLQLAIQAQNQTYKARKPTGQQRIQKLRELCPGELFQEMEEAIQQIQFNRAQQQNEKIQKAQ